MAEAARLPLIINVNTVVDSDPSPISKRRRKSFR
jgi:hypothetical protein